MMRVIAKYRERILRGDGSKKWWVVCCPELRAIRDTNSNSYPVKTFIKEGSSIVAFQNEPGAQYIHGFPSHPEKTFGLVENKTRSKQIVR